MREPNFLRAILQRNNLKGEVRGKKRGGGKDGKKVCLSKVNRLGRDLLCCSGRSAEASGRKRETVLL